MGYRFLRGLFHSRVTQFMFSLLHPYIAFGLGNGWSKSNRLSHDQEYVFRGEDEPLVEFAERFAVENRIDYFIFGHYHADVRMTLKSGAELLVLKDCISREWAFQADLSRRATNKAPGSRRLPISSRVPPPPCPLLPDHMAF